jgi:putative ABC transport system permease protein
MDHLLQDLRLAVRGLLRRRTFSTVAILTLAIGIGATTAVFSILDAVILRPLPYREPSRLFRVWQAFPEWKTSEAMRARWDRVGISYPQYLALRKASTTFENVTTVFAYEASVGGGREAERVIAARTTSTLLATLGLRPIVGRGLSASDEAGKGSPVAMIGYSFWQRSFGGEASAIGKTVTLAGTPYVIVGVIPPKLRLPGSPFGSDRTAPTPEVWVPVGVESIWSNGDAGHMNNAIVRVRAGVSAERARAVALAALRDGWATYKQTPATVDASVEPLGYHETRTLRTPLFLLFAAAGVVLLVACGNVANLMLADGTPCSRELAVRTTLGAGRWRIARMLLTESLVIAAPGGLLGVGVAWSSTGALVALAPAGTPSIDKVALDYRVLAFSGFAVVATALLCGVLPAWLSARGNVMTALRESRPTLSRVGARLQRLVSIAQIALGVVVLSVAMLLVQTLVRLAHVNPGFDAERVATFTVTLPRIGYQTPATSIGARGTTQAAAFYEQVRDRIAALPGVPAVTQTTSMPFDRAGFASNPIAVVGREHEKPLEAERRYVVPNFFTFFGIRVIEGRPLGDPHPGACEVAVSQATARRLWPDGGAIGALVVDRRMPRERPCTVVGIVSDVREARLDADPVPTYYRVAPAGEAGRAVVAFRSAVAAESLVPSIRKIVARLEPEAPVSDVATLDELIARTLTAERYRAIPTMLFALVAVLLAAIGTYGVMSQIVNRQFRALGIRMALGAEPSAMVRLMLHHAAVIALAGVAVGLPVALAVARLFRTVLFGVQPTDATTYAAVAMALTLLTIVAGWIPARRVRRLDPAEVLRAE